MNTIRLVFFYFFSYLCLGCVLSLLVPQLNNYFDLISKMIILGCAALLSFVLSCILGKISDSMKKSKPSFFVSMSIYMIGLTMVYFFHSFFGFIILISSTRLIMSQSETILLIEKKDSFGKYHCIGCLSLIIGSFLVYLLNDFVLYVVCMLSAGLSLLFICFYDESRREGNVSSFKDILSLFKNKDYVICLGIFFFLMLMGNADQYVVVDKMMDMDSSKFLISLKYVIQVFMEIPIYLCINKLFKKFELIYLLLFCIIMSILKFVFYALSMNLVFILLTSSLQIFTHPLIVLLSKRMILRHTDASLMASSQIVGFAVYYGLSGFVGAVIASGLQLYLSYDVILFIFAFIGFFPLLIWHKYKNMLN